jgi:hypothetical protein
MSFVVGLQSGSRLETGGLEFTNNYAFNPSMVNMPRDDFTVEFWARTPAYTDRTSGNSFQSFFSYATHTEKDSTCECPCDCAGPAICHCWPCSDVCRKGLMPCRKELWCYQE